MRKRRKKWLASACLGLSLTMLPVVSGNAAVAEQKTEEKTGMARWELRDDGWYYYGTDGRLATGWTIVEDQYYYLTETGLCLQNTVTPDGYYVNPDGAWQVRSAVILGNEFQGAEKVLSVTDAWNGNESMKKLQEQIRENFKNRRIRITDSAMEYRNGDTLLMGIYKNAQTGGFRFDIRTELDSGSTEPDTIAAYDYAVFRAFLYQVTAAPDYLEEAIYSSWQGDNRWNIQRNETTRVGDSDVRYDAGERCGYYHIYPARER